ncbi:MAG TPA: enoyl-CoA hydratase/isomerase family protein [Paenalcaligenes sp.]|nr:enoyl-CoA hydratase/isomerase family protein [Paenalcaligenes sp.]
MTSQFNFIAIQIKENIATLQLNRPDKMNAINDGMRSELITALESIHQDPSIKALILTGSGSSFCAGGDIAGMRERHKAPLGEVGFNGWQRQQKVHHSINLLHTLPKPTIAAVQGAAVGLGADLALACDFVMAAESAYFSWSYAHRGLIPDGGGMYFLPRRVGLAKAKELIFSGRKINSNEAFTLGIADRQAEDEALLEQAHTWLTELTQGSPKAIALTKTILNQSYELSAQHIFEMGSQAQGICYATPEHQQAVQEFLNPDKPQKKS